MKMKFVKKHIFYGCTDNGNLKSSKYPGYSACNYDLRAEVDDGSCEYETCLGCTDNHCDETYDTKYTIPAQEFYGYGVCEPCSYLSVPTNNYPPYKSNDFAFPKKSFLYERGNVKYNKAFGELTFGYLSKDEITKSVGELRKYQNNLQIVISPNMC